MSGPGDEVPRLVVEVKERCAWVTLDRPAKLNALDTQAYRELEATAAGLASREDVAVVVLTGAGRAFCAGADLEGFARDVDLEDAHAVRSYLRWVGSVVKAVAAWASRLAESPGRALGLIKAGLLASPLLDLDAMLEWEANAIAFAFATHDVHESLAAFRERRAPVYTGR